MNKILILFALFTLCHVFVFSQETGNRAYGTQRRGPLQSSGVLTASVDGKSVYYIEANVLANIKPDAFVAVFGLVQEAANSAASNDKINTQLAAFMSDLGNEGIGPNAVFVDFITQNKIYDFTTEGSTVTEKFSGFETKKNIAVRYKDRDLLEKLLSAAARRSIFDLIEVDYVFNDAASVRGKLYDEAVKVIKQKEASYANAFAIKLAPTNLANEKYDVFYPGELYSGYRAYEAGSTSNDYNKVVVRQRKTSTFYYDPLDGNSFDAVINQIGLEPVVQFTLHMRVQYEMRK
jgi:uncharacterized protein YggE